MKLNTLIPSKTSFGNRFKKLIIKQKKEGVKKRKKNLSRSIKPAGLRPFS